MQGDTIHDASHAELAHTIVDMSTKLDALRLGTHRDHTLPVREVRSGQVGRSAEHLRQHLDQVRDGLLGSLARGDSFSPSRHRSQHRLGLAGKINRQVALHAPIKLCSLDWKRLGVSIKTLLPGFLCHGTGRTCIPSLIDVLRDQERLMWPS